MWRPKARGHQGIPVTDGAASAERRHVDVPQTITVTGYDADGDQLAFELWQKNVWEGSLALPFVNTQCTTDPETGASTCTAQTTYTPQR